MRTANPADPSHEAPMLYSRVGRRSSPGLPAVAVAIESVRVGGSPSTTSPAADDVDPLLELTAASSPPPAFVAPPETPPPTERNNSRRPPAPDAFSSDLSDGESIARTLDRLIASDALSHATLSQTFPKEESLTGPRELFGTLAVAHVRPVRELLIELRWGEASKDAFLSAAAAVQSLRGAAESLSLKDLAGALEAFARTIEGEQDATTRARVAGAYAELERLLPAAFAFEAERAQRESLVVQSLVLQVPDARRATLDRIVSAGLGTIATLAAARPAELAEVTGIPLSVASRIVEAVSAFRDKKQSEPASDDHAEEHDRLRALCADIAGQNAAFEEASNAWSADAGARKKLARQTREQTWVAVSALLARLGEIPLLEQLDRLPFEQKLDRLHSYLNEKGHAPAAR